MDGLAGQPLRVVQSLIARSQKLLVRLLDQTKYDSRLASRVAAGKLLPPGPDRPERNGGEKRHPESERTHPR